MWVKIKVLLMCSLFCLLSLNFMTDDVYAAGQMGPERVTEKLFRNDEDRLKTEIDKVLKNDKLNGSQIREIEPGKGGFYKAYEEEIEAYLKANYGTSGGSEAANKAATESARKMFKDFDYYAGTFNCKWSDVNCHINDGVYSIGSGLISGLMSPFKNLVLKPSEVLNDQLLSDYKGAFKAISNSLLIALFIFQLLKILAFRLSDVGSVGKDTEEKTVKFIFAAFFILMYDSLFTFFMNIQYAFNYPLMAGLSTDDSLAKSMSLTFLFAGNIFLGAAFILIVGVMMFVIMLQLYYGIALISLLYVIGPAAISTSINDEYNFFSVWLKVLSSRLLTMGLQALAIVLGFRKMGVLTFDSTTAVGSGMIGIAFFIVAMSIPGLLGQFGNSSGSGRFALGSFKTVTRYLSLAR
ncbi:hypothetical protein R6Z02_14805 [Carnobacterium maltaromaticum]|uniref:conjugal transfer protein TrbL family protein n=1 Tax=Carnobacterium maltaromaticum TaxID=2751 RepID=UPI00298A2EAF|nr:conjugal transfer protein TrbL family protein [Carnobacterium maltaromaticum]MDW5525024.1 hypothetical protein [Carnobacterium maltaromaticum]